MVSANLPNNRLGGNPVPILASSGTLRIESELNRRSFVEIVAGPQAVEEVEAQVSSEGVADHFVVILAETCGSRADGPQHALVDREGYPRSCHRDIMMLGQDPLDRY